MENLIENLEQDSLEKFRKEYEEILAKIGNKEELNNEELQVAFLCITNRMVELVDTIEGTLIAYINENHVLKVQNDRLYAKNKKLTSCLENLPAMIRESQPINTISTKEITDDFKVITTGNFIKENGTYHQKLMKILSEKDIMYKNGKNWNLKQEYFDKGYVVYVVGHNKNYSDRKLMWTEAGVAFLKEAINSYNNKPKNTEAIVENSIE